MFTNGTPNLKANDYGKHNRNTGCCNSSENIHSNYKKIYEEKYFLLEKFVYTDIENSENKKPIRNFRLSCSKAFYNRLPIIFKGN